MSKHYQRYNAEDNNYGTQDYNYLPPRPQRGLNYHQSSIGNRHYQRSQQLQLTQYQKYRNRNEYKAHFMPDKYQSPKYPQAIHTNFNRQQAQGRSKQFSSNKKQQYQDMNGVNIRQTNVRKQELQMRMNSINMYSDKINNLLSLVKRDQPRQHSSSKDKEFERTPTKYKAAVSYNKQTPVKIVQQPKSPQIVVQQQQDSFKQKNESIKRLRTLSLLSPNLGKQNEEENARYEAQLNKEVKDILQSSNKKGSKQKQTKRVNQSSTQKNNKDINQNSLRKNFRNIRTPINDKNTKREQSTPSKQLKYSPSKSSYQENPYNPIDYIPVTLINKQNREQASQQRYGHKYLNLKAVDDRIKRIKQQNKISNKNTVIPTNQNDQPQRKYVYSDSQQHFNNSGNKFQIKLMPIINNRNQTIKIAQKLSEQSKLDSSMKKAIKVFHQNQSQQKWQHFYQKLLQLGIKIALPQIKYLLSISPKQNNQSLNEQQTFNKRWSLVHQFSEAQRFWENEVKGCATRKMLKKQGFDVYQLDQQGNGHLITQDISRFILKYTGHSYSNNDVSLVFKRLQLLQASQNQQRIRVQTFLQAFST